MCYFHFLNYIELVFCLFYCVVKTWIQLKKTIMLLNRNIDTKFLIRYRKTHYKDNLASFKFRFSMTDIINKIIRYCFSNEIFKRLIRLSMCTAVEIKRHITDFHYYYHKLYEYSLCYYYYMMF